MSRATVAMTAIAGALIVSTATLSVGGFGDTAIAQVTDPNAETSSSAAAELHAVGIYEGYIKSGGEIHGSRANVVVDRPGKRVTLFLSAYERTTWLVEVRPGTTIVKVILGGYDRQVVKGMPADTMIINAYRDESGRVVVPYAYNRDSAEFRKMVKMLTAQTGAEISSFQGEYAARADKPFIIDAVERGQAKARLAPTYPQPTPATELPDISYSAILRRDGKTLYGSFTQRGPVMESMLPAPSGAAHLAFDPARKRYYVIKGHGVVEFDPETGSTTPMDMGMDVPDLSWPCGIAFDTTRHRLLVASLGGEGFLYAYDPAAQQWSVLTSMNNIDLSSLTYDAKADALYGMAANLGGGGTTIKKFTADGQPIGDIQLDDPIMPGMVGGIPGNAGVQLVAASAYLVLIADEMGDDRKVITRTFIVDVNTGKALLAHVD